MIFENKLNENDNTENSPGIYEQAQKIVKE